MSERKPNKSFSEMTPVELAEFDAETEEDFLRVVQAAKRPKKRKREGRLIGAPREFLEDVCRLTRGRAPLVVALYVYRQTIVNHTTTVPVPSSDIARLGVDRSLKSKALSSLETAGIVRLQQTRRGRMTEVTLLWRPRAP
jgi:hypothetical protein